MSDSIRKILDDRERFSFAVFIFLLLVFAFFLLVKYDLGTFFRMDRILKETHENLNTLANTVDYKNYINQFDSQFVGTGNTSGLMEILTDLVNEKNVTLESIKPLESYSVLGYRIIGVTAEGTASYPSILSLLFSIEDYSKYIRIESLTINAGRKSTDFPDPFVGRGLMPPHMRPEQPEARKTKFTLTIVSPAREI
ncbi:MAG: GspMb/PilO family protein [Candidatus Omnitrophota bacterium]|jgi:hypothetical protein